MVGPYSTDCVLRQCFERAVVTPDSVKSLILSSSHRPKRSTTGARRLLVLEHCRDADLGHTSMNGNEKKSKKQNHETNDRTETISQSQKKHAHVHAYTYHLLHLPSLPSPPPHSLSHSRPAPLPQLCPHSCQDGYCRRGRSEQNQESKHLAKRKHERIATETRIGHPPCGFNGAE